MALNKIFKNGMTAVKYDDLYVQLGGRAIRHRGQATTRNTLGTVIVNASEGMMTQTVRLPLGVTSVNKDYVLDYIKDRATGRSVCEHQVGDNSVTIGPRATPYLIAPGVVLVEHNEMGLKFDGKPMPNKEFSIPRNSGIHITEAEEIIMETASPVRGRGARS
jgi:hypothetical protein